MVEKMISLALVSVLALTVFSSSVSASESEVVFGGKYDSVIKTLPNTSISELAFKRKPGKFPLTQHNGDRVERLH
ncbi:hypothetical protein [Bacillus altitudinis]|uniref:hypothetical protein n=1 Tax=Bacillus altitudinis TaxID=293387 RepID=UPI0039826403